MAAETAGQIVKFYGNVWVSSGDRSPWKKITKPQKLSSGFSVKTGRLSGASLRMEDESLIRLSQNSEFKVESVRISSFWRRATSLVSNINQSVQSTYRLLTGKLWGRNNNRRLNSKIITTTATIGIRGTEYAVEAGEDASRVSILEGVVLAENEQGQTTISSGEQAIIEAGRAPQKSTIVQIGQSVQWTVQVPEIIDFGLFLKHGLDDKLLIADIFHAYQQSQYSRALDLLQSVIEIQPENLNLQLIQAWVNIKAGESSTVYPQLKTLAKSHKQNTILNELTAFTAFVNGDLDNARSILADLKKQRSISATGWILSGYIHQAAYDLPAAQKAYDRALQLEPGNQIAMLAQARLYFGSEQTQRAFILVNKILKNQPGYPDAQNLRGFILLANNESSKALVLWEELSKAAKADAQTYFGLSLAYMRKGQVEQAMQSIATAVLLDSQRSMYLSYWGKMLHQIGRNDKALTVLDSAIRLDSNDPTPRLYKAIILRDLNRPGEAIRQIQAAEKLNDNRGVYRSRSLLDKDLAVQNVDLSRLYTQLGLSEWAHKKAMDSIKLDFTNVSAHIINAGAFAEQPDRSYALANEALVARLLQPANINAFSSFNGYTSLYEFPDTEFDLELGVGNHGQQLANLIAVGAKPDKQLAWSLAAVHEDSDGWRDTNGETFNNLSVIAKWQPDQQNNFLLTFSAFEFKQLDELDRRFEIDSSIDELAQRDLDVLQLELGLHRKLNVGHDLLVYLSLIDSDGNVIDNPPFDSTLGDAIVPFGSDENTNERILGADFDRPLVQFQIQGLKQILNHQIFYGLLYIDGENKSVNSINRGLFDPEHKLFATFSTPIISTNELDINFTSLYIQDSWRISPEVQLDLAAYFEEMDNANAFTGGEWTIKETTTRLGLVWQASEQHTLRIASFEYLLPFISSRLDPTDIAGIPIFKNTNEGSLVTETDIVWDFEWENGLVSTSLFKVEDSFTSASLVSGSQVETTRINEKTGASVKLNTILGPRTGIDFGLSHFDVDFDDPDSDRKENNASFTLTHVFENSLTVSASQILRQIDFDSDRSRESIDITNLKLSYEFADKQQQVEFAVINLLDEEFNWVTDDFTTTGFAPERMILAKYRVSF